jgi:hypothetical protein
MAVVILESRSTQIIALTLLSFAPPRGNSIPSPPHL